MSASDRMLRVALTHVTRGNLQVMTTQGFPFTRNYIMQEHSRLRAI
jgi:hypothetical protein